MVEDADLTYSPISFKRSRRTLLGTPTSLARALTRILDTSLLYSARSRVEADHSQPGGTHF